MKRLRPQTTSPSVALNGIQKVISSMDPLKEKPYSSPRQMNRYAQKAGLYDGFRRVDSAIIVYTVDWLRYLEKEIGPPERDCHDFLVFQDSGFRFILQNASPGGQTACHYMERLAALGVKNFIALGHCGGLTEGLQIGDLVIHERAIRLDSVSSLYQKPSFFSYPSKKLSGLLAKTCESFPTMEELVRGYLRGTTLTTLSMFREPEKRLNLCRTAGVHTVETEAASIFAFGKFHRVKVASLSVVSNLISPKKWIQEYFHPRISLAKTLMLRIAMDCLSRMS